MEFITLLYRWPCNWATGLITLINRVITCSTVAVFVWSSEKSESINSQVACQIRYGNWQWNITKRLCRTGPVLGVAICLSSTQGPRHRPRNHQEALREDCLNPPKELDFKSLRARSARRIPHTFLKTTRLDQHWWPAYIWCMLCFFGGVALVGFANFYLQYLDGGLLDVLFSPGEDYKYKTSFPHGMKLVSHAYASLSSTRTWFFFMDFVCVSLTICIRFKHSFGLRSIFTGLFNGFYQRHVLGGNFWRCTL